MKEALIAFLVILGITLPFRVNAQTVGGGDIIFNPKNANQVVFSHDRHVKGKALKCTDCHYKVFQMAGGPLKTEMSSMSKGEFCGACHNGEKAFSVKDSKSCSKCHK